MPVLPTPPVRSLLRVRRRAGATALASLRRLYRWRLCQCARISLRQRAVPPWSDRSLLPYAFFLGRSLTYHGLTLHTVLLHLPRPLQGFSRLSLPIVSYSLNKFLESGDEVVAITR